MTPDNYRTQQHEQAVTYWREVARMGAATRQNAQAHVKEERREEESDQEAGQPRQRRAQSQ